MMMINILTGIVAALHLFFLTIEMFLWTKPFGMKRFNLTPEFAEQTKVLAANQGLYNGFLSAGLIWSLLHVDPVASSEIRTFFLSCVIVAGIYGAITVNKRIFFLQALPAIIALGISFAV